MFGSLCVCARAAISAMEQRHSFPLHSAAPCAVDVRERRGRRGRSGGGAKDTVGVYSIQRYGKHVSVQVTAYLTS